VRKYAYIVIYEIQILHSKKAGLF